MAAIQGKRFNWLPKASAWQEMQSWRQRRQSVSENFGVASANLISSFTQAWDSQSAGLNEIAVNRATTRIQTEYQAKLNSLIDLTV